MSESAAPARDPARVLVMVEQPLLVEVIKLTLNHGVYITREAKDVSEATAVFGEWHPHLAVIDMDIGGDVLMRRMATLGTGGATRAPICIKLTEGEGRPMAF